MVYTNEKFENSPHSLPKPPAFLTWSAETTYDYRTRRYVPSGTGKGQIRHHLTLHGASRYLKRYIAYQDAEFHCDWALYQWDEDKRSYNLLYSGKAGQATRSNAMYIDKIRKGEVPFVELTDEVLQEVMESIDQSAQAVR